MDDFTQKQINELQNNHMVLERMVEQAISRANSNNDSLTALHKRQDEMGQKLAEIDRDMLTEEKLARVLETTFNDHVVRAIKQTFIWGISIVSVAITAWLTNIFGMKD